LPEQCVGLYNSLQNTWGAINEALCKRIRYKRARARFQNLGYITEKHGHRGGVINHVRFNYLANNRI